MQACVRSYRSVFLLKLVLCGGVASGDSNGKARAALRGARYIDIAPVGFDQLVHDGKAEPHPVSLCSKVGIEYVGEVALGDALTGIANGPNKLIQAAVDFDSQPASAIHGLQAV